MSKKVPIGSRPSKPAPKKSGDDWVKDPSPQESMKRLTVDIPESLHRRIKADCAERGIKIADEIRELLREKYPG